MNDSIFDKALGCFRGLAIGDALGAPVEFKEKGTFPKVFEYLPTPGFHLDAGQWTDDTIMALCMAEALIKDNGYNSFTVMDIYLDWLENGHNSPNGDCFDIGIQTRKALIEYKETRKIEAFSLNSAAGNGTIMRLAPGAIVSTSVDLEGALDLFGVSAADTHNSTIAIETTKLFGYVLRGFMLGGNRSEVFKEALIFNPGWKWLISTIENTNETTVSNSGYCVTSFGAAWLCFSEAKSYEETVLRAVNLGGDADTIAAIAGQLAGAYWGDFKIPQKLKDELYESAKFETLTTQLLKVNRGVIQNRFL